MAVKDDEDKNDRSIERKEERKSVMSRAKKRAQEQIEKMEEEHRRTLLRRRVELANQGVRAYSQKKIAEAVRHFQTYIGILEDWKDVEPGQLAPAHFDTKRDVAELLLISGVYWDLAKIYDRTTTPRKYREFQGYLDKFVLFSRGMPYQTVCAETLRKYISNEKPVHKQEFKNAYKLLGDSSCFIATSLVDVSDVRALPRMRAFRDVVLSRSVAGRAFTAWYYRHAPAIADRVDRLPTPLRRTLGLGLNQLSVLCAGWCRFVQAGSDTDRPPARSKARSPSPSP